VGIYDGHGGPKVSEFLQKELHGLLEAAQASTIPSLVSWLKGIGGYFKRFKGGDLAPWAYKPVPSRILDIEARATLAFLQADRRIFDLPEAQRSGATASVALLHSIESPPTPFFASRDLVLTVAHCGDTRILLCSTETGKVLSMTENHHAEARGEAARLRRLGVGLVTDSFGEARWMGALANTRGFGDFQFKPFGVTPEPEIRSQIIKDQEFAYIVFVSDGVTSILSDEEIIDIARDAPDPQRAAAAILSLAEELGSEDNATVLVVPLSGWGKVQGPDRTKDLRAYRKKQAVGSERQRRT